MARLSRLPVKCPSRRRCWVRDIGQLSDRLSIHHIRIGEKGYLAVNESMISWKTWPLTSGATGIPEGPMITGCVNLARSKFRPSPKENRKFRRFAYGKLSKVGMAGMPGASTAWPVVFITPTVHLSGTMSHCQLQVMSFGRS